MRIEVRNVRTLDDVMEFKRWLGQDRAVLAYDIETSGLSWHRDVIRLAQFGDARSAWVLSYEEWRGVVREALTTYTGPIVGHNVRFDIHFTLHDLGLPTEALDWTRIHDTLLMAHLIDPSRPKGLKPLAARYINPAAVAGQKDLDDDMHRGKWDWATVPIDLPSYRFYAGLDTSLTALLYEKFSPYIAKHYQRAYELEQMVAKPLFIMERKGMLLDPAYTEKAQGLLLDRADEVAAEVEQTWGINVGSLHAAGEIMVDDGWQPEEFTKSGNPSLTAEILEQIDHPLAEKIVTWRIARKAANTWLSKFLTAVDSHGRVHPNIRQVAARTGRMSVSDPPLQQLPRERDAKEKGLPSIRDCFVATPGTAIISADFSGIEARLFAHFAAEPDMLRTIHEGGDLHALVAAAAYQIPIGEVTKDQRQIAKAVNFASLYGAGPAKVAKTAKISEDESRDFFTRRNSAFPGIKRFQYRIMDRADEQRKSGETAHVTTHIGSRISIKDDEPEYRLTNYLIQGSAAVVLKDRILSLHNAGLTDMMCLPVHDEVLFEVPVEDTEEVRHVIAENMPDLTTFDVPLDVEISDPAPSWGAAK